MLLFIEHKIVQNVITWNFKTSHVIVYLLRLTESILLFTFQNISCYCLSVVNLIALPLQELFQNISCYCLSNYNRSRNNTICIFQNISCYCLSVFIFFNNFCIVISKHLMLLFILENTIIYNRR